MEKWGDLSHFSLTNWYKPSKNDFNLTKIIEKIIMKTTKFATKCHESLNSFIKILSESIKFRLKRQKIYIKTHALYPMV